MQRKYCTCKVAYRDRFTDFIKQGKTLIKKNRYCNKIIKVKVKLNKRYQFKQNENKPEIFCGWRIFILQWMIQNKLLRLRIAIRT